APVVFEGDRQGRLVQVLEELEGALVILERRGLNLASFLNRVGPGGLPTHRVLLGREEHWFSSRAEVEQFRRAKEAELGRELVVAGEAPGHTNGNGHTNGEPAPTYSEHELHEVRAINRGLERLRELGLVAADLVPAPRVAGREPPPRFVLESGDLRRVLPH